MSALRMFKAFVVIAVCALVLLHLLRTFVFAPEAKEPTPADFSLVVGGAGKLVERDAGIFEVVGQAGIVGAAFDTSKVEPNIKGYNAPIRMLGYLGSDGKIERLEVFRHEETPYYFRMVVDSGLLRDIEGRTPEEVAELDAVSGATVTSKAMMKEVALDAASVDSEIFGRDHAELARALGGRARLDAAAVLVAVLWVVAVASLLSRVKFLKYASWALGFFVVGLLMQEPLSISHVFRLADGAVPTPARLDFFLLFWGAVALSLALGRVFCLRACPFGVVQEVAYRLGHGSKINEGAPGRFSQIVRYGVFLILAVLFFGVGVRAAAEFEPYITLFSLRGGLWAWVFVAATIAVSLVVKRFWCRYFCPFGTFSEIVGWARKRGRAKDEEKSELA